MSDTHLTPAGAEDGRWNNILRRSVSGELVQAAVGDIAAAGHDRVIVLGDVSDLGAADAVRTVLDGPEQHWVSDGSGWRRA
jgi:hypothetical protein